GSGIAGAEKAPMAFSYMPARGCATCRKIAGRFGRNGLRSIGVASARSAGQGQGARICWLSRSEPFHTLRAAARVATVTVWPRPLAKNPFQPAKGLWSPAQSTWLPAPATESEEAITLATPTPCKRANTDPKTTIDGARERPPV